MKHLARAYHFLIYPHGPVFHLAFALLHCLALAHHLYHAEQDVEKKALNRWERD